MRVERLATGLEIPWGLAFLPNGNLLVTERPGRLRLVRGGKLVPKPVAAVAVAPAGEGGLLGIALHPRFSENRLLYLYVTHSLDENRVERWKLSADESSASFESVVVAGIAAGPVHQGGRIRFGPDEMLYVSTGDARSPESSKAEQGLNGRLLRLTPEGKPAPGNPQAGNATLLRGLRNSHGFDWLDASTLVVADHGPSGEFGRYALDEVSVARAGDNLGWPTISGCTARPGLVSPIITWRNGAPPGGLALQRSTSPLDGGTDAPTMTVWVASLGGKRLERLVLSTKQPFTVTQRESLYEGDAPTGYGRLREALLGPDGHLYLTTSNCDGRGTCPGDRDAVLKLTLPR